MSDELIVDLTNYKDRVGSRVMPGRYTVVVEDVESDTARSGNPMVNLWLRIQGGEFDGATIVDRLVLTEKSLFRVVGFMQAIGLPTPRKRMKINVRHFAGKVLDIDVEDGEPYNGRVKSEVRGYMRAAAAPVVGTDDLEDLDVESGTDAPQEYTADAPTADAAKTEPTAEGETVDLEEMDLDDVDV